jgi:uncharacterized tellurite resistance protein B-like protein
VVRSELPEADEETCIVVCAIASLLGAVAFADRDYSQAEEQQVRAELEKIQGMRPAGANAICAVLRSRIREIATVEVPQHCTALRELGDDDLRFEVLRLLVEVAAADERITFSEATLLRQITQFLGLQQDDYTALQQKHREKLEVLAPRSSG